MKNTSEHMNKSTCVTTANGSRHLRTNYDAELKTWVQQVILDAEKKRNFKKRSQYLSLLKTF
jgi:hypothetical protein